MKSGMSYQIEGFFCMEWCMQQFMDKYQTVQWGV